MATQTTNLRLSKAEQTDAILDTLRANNSNFDTLDSKITEIENQLDVGSPEGSGGVIILEASTDNVVDFDTLTEPGYYLIKNCSDTVGTTINSGFTSTNETARKDILLMVSSFLNPNGDLYLYHTKSNTYSSIAEQRYAFNGTWQPWKRIDIPASWIASGTFPAGVSCNTPTADTHLANKAYVDSVASGAGGGSSEGITVLEASTENVIDFNTLTEPGIYLISGCSDGAGTTLNSGITNVNFLYTVILEVVLSNTVEGYSTPADNIFQRRYEATNALPYTRRYNKLAETPAWSEWTYGQVGAANITAGTLAGKVRANETEAATLSAGQVRNIYATTTDKTAGTSGLDTGTICLVYE